jgi:type IV secretory pathway protease TraF
VRLARAFTCYQLAALLEALEAAPAQDGSHPQQGEVRCPLLMLDLLATFGDQSVAVRERRRLLGLCLAEIKRLAQAGRPVGIWLRARTVAPAELLEFQARVEQAAGRVWRVDYLPPAAIQQGRLF